MARAIDRLDLVVDAMCNEHGHLDRGEDISDVGVAKEALED